MSEKERIGGSRDFSIPLVGLILTVLAWLWPIGIGGSMPVGGDVTQFSIGLMGYLSQSLREGRLPLWNHLWGYGFPGLAESQMGVFYLPHLLLYGLLGTETAYTVSLVLHTLMGAVGVYWAGSRFGLSPKGAALSAFAWTGSGFFVIHLPHQWGYTTGCWLPWAVGLAWTVVNGERPARSAAWLAAVLAIQLLPGHFQLGFITEVSVLAVLAVGLACRVRSGEATRSRMGVAVLSLLGMIPMAAAQLGPTADLARLASSMRDWEYLAGFAATPFHLISYVAPGLFRRSPLWRNLAWDTFHTSPEEYLGYVGLVPLILAIKAVMSGWKADRRVLVLLGLTGVSLVFSLGPYLPGSGTLFQLPGFSFFRAPARWTIATSLGLSLLAGVGFDGWRGWIRPGRSVVRFALGACVLLASYALVIEGAFLATEPKGSDGLKKVYEQAFALMPWKGDPSFADRMREARLPWNDFRAQASLARQGVARPTAEQLTLGKQRHAVLIQELAPTLALLAALAIAATVVRWPGVFESVLLLVTLVDLLLLVQLQRPTDIGPIRPLVAQSPMLAELAGSGGQGRLVDTSRNLPILVGAAPVSGYRTLDLPVAQELTNLTREPLGRPGADALLAEVWRATGVKFRVLEPFEWSQARRQPPTIAGWGTPRLVRDRNLAVWLFGAAWVAANSPQSEEFGLMEASQEATVAWLLPGRKVADLTTDTAPRILEVLRSAIPLKVVRERPESLRIEVPEGTLGTVVVTQLSVPGWSAEWSGSGKAAGITGVLGGWQGVERLEPGAGDLRLDYRERTLIPSLAISGAAWLIWVGLQFEFLRRSRRTATEVREVKEQS